MLIVDADLAAQQIELIAPHRKNRKRNTQDRQPLRRKQRWKIERGIAWLQTYRCLVVRYERHSVNFLGFVQLAYALILLRQFF